MIRFAVDVIARFAVLAFMVGHVSRMLHIPRSDLSLVFVPVILYWLFGAGVKRAANGYGYRFWGKMPWPNIDYVGRWEELTAMAVWAILVIAGVHLIPFIWDEPFVYSFVLFWIGFLVFIVSRIGVGRRVDDDD